MEKEVAKIVQQDLMSGKKASILNEPNYINYNVIKHLSNLGYQVNVFASPNIKTYMLVYIS